MIFKYVLDNTITRKIIEIENLILQLDGQNKDSPNLKMILKIMKNIEKFQKEENERKIHSKWKVELARRAQ